MIEARQNVRRTVSPARPIPCASDDVMGMTPRSCSTFSAPMVRARMWSRAMATLLGTAPDNPCTDKIMSKCSATASRPNGSVGFIDDPITFGIPARLRASGVCPPPQPSTWKAWAVRPSSTAMVSRTSRLSFSPSVWIGNLHVVLVGDTQGRVEGSGVRAQIVVDLEPAGAALDEGFDQRSGSGRRPPREEPDFDRPRIKGGEAVRRARGELIPTPQTGPNSWAMIVVTPDASDASITRAQGVDVRVDHTCGRDQPLAADDGRARADVHLHAVESVGVAGSAYRADAATPHPDRGLAYAHHRIDQQDVAYHQVACVPYRSGAQMHPVAGRPRKAGKELAPGYLRVMFDLDDEARVRQHNTVAEGGSVPRLRHGACSARTAAVSK